MKIFKQFNTKTESCIRITYKEQKYWNYAIEKDCSIVVLVKDNYNKACLDIIIDTNYHEELNENPNNSY